MGSLKEETWLAEDEVEHRADRGTADLGRAGLDRAGLDRAGLAPRPVEQEETDTSNQLVHKLRRLQGTLNTDSMAKVCSSPCTPKGFELSAE